MTDPSSLTAAQGIAVGHERDQAAGVERFVGDARGDTVLRNHPVIVFAGPSLRPQHARAGLPGPADRRAARLAAVHAALVEPTGCE
jgi:hypothetical protein